MRFSITRTSLALSVRPEVPIFKSKTFNMIIFVMVLTVYVHSSSGHAYSDTADLFRDKLGNSSNYNTDIRPVLDQSQAINVLVEFFIIAISELDDINQKFVVNGIMNLYWVDEMVKWDLATYNYVSLISPDPDLIWRPRLVLFNTLGDRDLFEDEYSPVIIANDGNVTWYPGSLFPTACKLNMKKFPFDQQVCQIQMFSMNSLPTELFFTPLTGVVNLAAYTESGTWNIESTRITNNSEYGISSFVISFTLTRRSGFFILNIVMPVVMLSLLNIMVFLIPVESGEKISYGITVLLALAVFMSIVSGMLPRSSDVLPLVTIYLVILLVTSVCTVVVTIFIVWLHFGEEKENKRHKAKKSFQDIFKKVRLINRATAPNVVKPLSTVDKPEKEYGPSLLAAVKGLENSEKDGPIPKARLPLDDPERKPYINKYKKIGRHIDTISFVVFMLIWVTVTIGFIVEITS